MSNSVRAVVACCAALPLLTACGGSDPIDPVKAEQRIKAGYERQVEGSKVESVTCPDDLERKPGVTGTCRLTLANGVSGKVRITVRDDNKIEWTVEGALRTPGATAHRD